MFRSIGDYRQSKFRGRYGTATPLPALDGQQSGAPVSVNGGGSVSSRSSSRHRGPGIPPAAITPLSAVHMFQQPLSRGSGVGDDEGSLLGSLATGLGSVAEGSVEASGLYPGPYRGIEGGSVATDSNASIRGGASLTGRRRLGGDGLYSSDCKGGRARGTRAKLSYRDVMEG